MIPRYVKDILEKQHYFIVGKHSAVQICRWTKKSIRGEGVCYKEKFYGIKCHQCCQMTPAVVWCQNKCLHCWRAIEHTLGAEIKNGDSPSEIIDKCIEAQKKLLIGFKKSSKKNKQLSRVALTSKHFTTSSPKRQSKADMKKWEEAQEPMQFAISLSGEPTLYENIGGLIEELCRRGKTSFLVTNGLMPEKIKELKDKKQLPTQLYVSVNVPKKEMYQKFHRSCEENAWEKLNKTLEILPTLTPQAYNHKGCENLQAGPEESSQKILTKGNCRTVFRINLIKDFNMGQDCAREFAELIKKSQPTFVELKGFMSVGFARQRLGYDKMPWHKDVLEFARALEKELNSVGENYKVLDEHEKSCAVVMGKIRGG